jgi:hypothetical protein
MTSGIAGLLARVVAAVDQVVVRGWVVADARMTTSVKVIDL